MKSENINDIAKALAAAQGEIEGADRSATNQHGGYKYADLASIWAACRTPLSKNGLAVSQVTDIDGDSVILITTLMHISGQWISGRMPVRIAPMFDKGTNREKPWTPQAFGSAITYARKYSLAAIAGVSSEDDDGEEASRPQRQDAPASNGFRIADPVKAAEAIAMQGVDNFRSYWTMLGKEDRERLKPHIERLKTMATVADTGEVLDEPATEHMAAIKSEAPIVKPVNAGRTNSFVVPVGVEPAPRDWADHRDEILRRLGAAPEHAADIEAANRTAIARSPHRAEIAAAIHAAQQAATLTRG